MAEFIFHGKTMEEIKSMEQKDFMKLIPSRERRKLKRGLNEGEKKFLKKLKEVKDKNNLVRTRERDMLVLPEMLGFKLGIHNGKEYVTVEVKPEMLGHRLGEFALSRKRVKHSSPGFGATRSSKFVPLK
jgi:small subunit ribosomal protein S19